MRPTRNSTCRCSMLWTWIRVSWKSYPKSRGYPPNESWGRYDHRSLYIDDLIVTPKKIDKYFQNGSLMCWISGCFFLGTGSRNDQNIIPTDSDVACHVTSRLRTSHISLAKFHRGSSICLNPRGPNNWTVKVPERIPLDGGFTMIYIDLAMKT